MSRKKNMLEAEPLKFGLHFEPSSLLPLKSLGPWVEGKTCWKLSLGDLGCILNLRAYFRWRACDHEQKEKHAGSWALEIWVAFWAFKPTSAKELVTISIRKNVLEVEPWKFGLHFEPSNLLPLKSLGPWAKGKACCKLSPWNLGCILSLRAYFRWRACDHEQKEKRVGSWALEIWVAFWAFEPTSAEELVTMSRRKSVLEAEP
jgi:hypothetical protein